MLARGVINTFPVFEEFYSTELLRDYFPASIARIGSTQTFAMFTIAYILGPLFDAGYLQPMLWIGSALSTLGLFMTSFCVQFWQLFLAQGVITGIGFGCLLLPALALPTIHFERNLSLAMGLISCGGAVGGLILPVIFNTVRDSFHFAWATQVLAFILLGNCVLPLALLRYPRQPSENIFRLAGSAQERFTWLVSQLTDFLGFRDRYYVYVSLALALGAGGFHVMLANINLFTRDWTDSHKNIYLSMLEINTAASLAGRTVVPAVADRLGATNMQGLTALSSFVLAFSALAMKTADDMIAWSVGFGTCQGTFACLSIVGLVSKSRTRVGTKIGTASLMVGIGIFLASVIGDNILNGRWLWTGLIVWCALLLMASFVCTTAARIQLTGREIITRI